MNFTKLIFTYLNVIFIFNMLILESFTIFQMLKREIRFSKYEVISLNQSIVTVYESTFKQFKNNKQTLFFHGFVHERIYQFYITYSINKCKEHFIDCVNVISYEVCDMCSKISVIMHFHTGQDQKSHLVFCPIFGEYQYTNISIDADKFGSFFSLPTEKYWEHFWQFKLGIYNENKLKFLTSNTDFYFIQFRSRSRTPTN